MAHKHDFKRRKEVVNSLAPPVHKLTAVSPFYITEAYKILRTNLLFALAGQESKAVVISSALPSEGKSTVCTNLAITMAQTGAKILLIDADLRKPVQHKAFRLNNIRGLTTLLAGFDSFGDVLQKKVEPNLDVLPSGPIPPNPSELLGSENMAKLLATLTDYCDYIFLDTPPINVVADALVLANLTAGVVLVGRQNQTTHDQLAKAITTLEFAGANILGLVINDVREQGRGLGGKYRGYRYSYSSDK